VVALVFIVLAFVVHHKIARHFQFQSGDVDWLRWQRVNRRLGLCVGTIAGAASLILISVPIYTLGYTTVQVSAEENDPFALKVLNQARYDLRETGLDKIAARFDPAPEQYYKMSDIMGLLHHNPPLHQRMALYPPFLAHSDVVRVDVSSGESASVDMFQQMEGGGVENVVFAMAGMLALHLQSEQREPVDLDDLETFLRTGKSPLYDSEPILGRWEIDPDSLISQVRRLKPNITSTELIMLRRAADSLAGVSFVATPDKQASLQFKSPQAEAPPPVDDDPYGMQDRYGGGPARPGTQGGRQRAQATPPGGGAAANPFQVFLMSAKGRWSYERGEYRVQLQNQGREFSFTAEADQDTLVISEGGQVLVFYRAY
jgi:hypothetical protein